MSNIVERLRSPATVFYEYAADNGAFLREAADEITRLREENERLREAFEKAANDMRPMLRSMISRNEAEEIVRRAARAALEGVTEPASPWRDIESAPRDGTPILCVKQGSGFQPEILHFEDGVFGWLTDDMGLGFGCHPYCQPTHWMPLPEPPR